MMNHSEELKSFPELQNISFDMFDKKFTDHGSETATEVRMLNDLPGICL